MRLLLFSNSTKPGEEYLSFTLPYMQSFLANSDKRAMFIPYAGISLGYDKYFEMVAEKLSGIGIQVKSLHQEKIKSGVFDDIDVIITGGGNTFCLLKSLYDLKILALIKEKVASGKLCYIGWSAGSNLASPTIKTTNDMPIAEPESFEALSLIPFQINPHYTDETLKNHGGESREMRIREFLQVNQKIKVAGLREGTLLEYSGNKLELKGNKNCKVFRYKQEAIEIAPGENMDILLQ